MMYFAPPHINFFYIEKLYLWSHPTTSFLSCGVNGIFFLLMVAPPANFHTPCKKICPALPCKKMKGPRKTAMRGGEHCVLLCRSHSRRFPLLLLRCSFTEQTKRKVMLPIITHINVGSWQRGSQGIGLFKTLSLPSVWLKKGLYILPI